MTEQPKRRPGRPRKKPVTPESSGIGGAEISPVSSPSSEESPKPTPEGSTTSVEAQPMPETPRPTPGTGGPVSYAPEKAPETPQEPQTPAMEELRARHEAKAAEEPRKGPSPYSWKFSNANMVPMAYRNLDTGAPDPEKISADIEDAWQHDRIPSILGVLISVTDGH